MIYDLFYNKSYEVFQSKEYLSKIFGELPQYAAHLFYCIGKKYWGQGIVTEALNAVLNFAYEIIGFNRIETYHSINNPASGRVMQKSRMIF